MCITAIVLYQLMCINVLFYFAVTCILYVRQLICIIDVVFVCWWQLMFISYNIYPICVAICILYVCQLICMKPSLLWQLGV